MSNPLDTAKPSEVAEALGTSEQGLAQMRYRGTGPKYVKVGEGLRGRVIYRWSDVKDWLDSRVHGRTSEVNP